MTQQA